MADMRRGPVLVLRPEPGASRTGMALTALGFAPLLYPLFAAEAVAWVPPAPTTVDALLMTSANAARLGGAGLVAYRDVPLFAVGTASARAAAEAGFTDVTVGGGDAASTLPLIVAAGHAAIVHLCGAVVRPYDAAGLRVTRLPVYRTVGRGDAAGLAAMIPPDGCAAMIHSPRAGSRLAAFVSPPARARIALVAISGAAAAACGSGWRAVAVADRPDDDAMLTTLQKLV
jgi:uroporphyrinogen-III synthase